MKRSLWIWFAILGGLLLANAIVSQSVMRSLIEDRRAWQEIRELKGNLNGLLSDIKDAETGQRGYLLAGTKEYLQPYLDSQQKIKDRINTITGLSALSPLQAETFLQIVTLIGRKQQEMESSILAYQTSGPSAAEEILDTGMGRKIMDEIRLNNSRIVEALDEQLQDLNRRSLTNQNSAFWLSLITNITGIIFLGIFYLFTRRSFEQRAALMIAQQAAAEKVSLALNEKENAFAEVSRANKIKDEFLAIVSHELRTPLNAILGWSTLLKAGGTEAEINEAMESIERNAKSQAGLIEDLLDVSRIISGKIRLQITAVDLQKIIVNVLESQRPALEAKGLRLVEDFSADRTEVLGDAARLQQVAWNLVSNAIKFTPQGGRIEIGLSVAHSDVIFLVKDSGQGIAKEFLPHIFNRFTQADTTTTRRQGGLGLGLAIVRHIVELHGGKVTAESEGEGLGACFKVEIPLMAVRPLDDHRLAAPVSATPAEMPRLSGKVVLVVDDQLDTLRILTSVLERCQATVKTASDARQALLLVEQIQPDLLISDIGMPEEDGYSLIAKVRKLPSESLRRVPALALSAFAKKEDREHALQAGFDEHLAKPADALELASMAAELLSRRRI